MEIMTVVALLCYLASKDGEQCHEEIVMQMLSMTRSCVITMDALTKWKEHSEFKSADWGIRRIDCKTGDYRPKDVI